MLERTRSAAEQNHITNVEFHKSYAEELSVADGEGDVTKKAVCHIEDVTDCLFSSMGA